MLYKCLLLLFMERKVRPREVNLLKATHSAELGSEPWESGSRGQTIVY